jgi:diguanylate cyclase (GGDEF)-like protein
MVDRRALLGLVAGLAGLAFGVGSVVAGVPALAVAAAGSALLAGAASLLLLQGIQEAERRAAGATALVKLLDIPTTARADAGALVDADTGLPDQRFFDLAMENRIAAARRHLWPTTVVLLEATLQPASEMGRMRVEALAAVARLLRRTLREADIACRVGPTSFALVLEDTSEEGGVWTAERIQVALAQDVSQVRRLAAGVASYPTHGLGADEVLARAQAALTRACAGEPGRGLGHVEVAQADSGH